MLFGQEGGGAHMQPRGCGGIRRSWRRLVFRAFWAGRRRCPEPRFFIWSRTYWLERWSNALPTSFSLNGVWMGPAYTKSGVTTLIQTPSQWFTAWVSKVNLPANDGVTHPDTCHNTLSLNGASVYKKWSNEPFVLNDANGWPRLRFLPACSGLLFGLSAVLSIRCQKTGD